MTSWYKILEGNINQVLLWIILTRVHMNDLGNATHWQACVCVCMCVCVFPCCFSLHLLQPIYVNPWCNENFMKISTCLFGEIHYLGDHLRHLLWIHTFFVTIPSRCYVAPIWFIYVLAFFPAQCFCALSGYLWVLRLKSYETYVHLFLYDDVSWLLHDELIKSELEEGFRLEVFLITLWAIQL